MSDEAAADLVRMGARQYRVNLSAESVGRSYYRVTFDGSPPRSWKAAEVVVNAANAVVCMKCKRPPADPCLHVKIVTKWLAAQPLVAVPGLENRHATMMRKLEGRA